MPLRIANIGALIVPLLLLASTSCAASDKPTNLEKPLCWGWFEHKYFQTLSDLAGKNGRPEAQVPGVLFQEQTFSTPDARTIYGYRAYAEAAKPQDQDAIIIIPGNAMLADQLYDFAGHFAGHNMTAYIFDYRGYGGSSGIPYANAMIDDYRKIFSLVRSKGHIHVNIYALSFGGIIGLAAIQSTRPPTALVLDGVPSQLPWYAFCPKHVDPILTIKYAPKRTLVISGSGDPVVAPSDTAALRQEAIKLGMNAVVLEGFSHPGLDPTDRRLRRLELVGEYLR